MSDVLTRTLGDADPEALGAPVALDGLDAHADPGRLLGLRIHQLNVADVDRGLLRDDPAGLAAATRGPDLRVLLDPVDALDQYALGLGVDGDHLAGLAAVAALALGRAGDDLDGVALLDAQLRHLRAPPEPAK